MTEQTSGSDKNVFVGIDFGTTKTMVASYDVAKKSSKPLTMGRGKFEKPTSMYATEAGDLLFGDDADDHGITDHLNHIRRFKMKLGKPGLAHVGRKTGTAQQLTTEFLSNLRDQLENQVLHTSVNRVVLTVPAMFGPAQRKELTAAAHDAGFSGVELLQEPVAAGIAYCSDQSDLSKQLRFIVVDWGGGTFDVAHLERLPSGEIKVHEEFVIGLDDIGGEVFDDQLWSIASSVLDSAGHGTLDGQLPENWGRYRRDLSRAKEALSSKSSHSMPFRLAGYEKPAQVTLNRSDFNNNISPMIQKAASFVSELIVRAHNAGCPPEFILLAGGTSRIPLIGQELERITGVKCRQWSDGREAIALGAAIRANQLWGQQSAVEAKEEREASDVKLAAMAQYKSLLEGAWIDGVISNEERVFLGKKRKELSLTIEESQAIQIQILGNLIEDVAKPEVRESIPDDFHFEVVLVDAGSNKIAVIKALREVISNLGLAEAKRFAESTPIIIIQDASIRSAEEVRSYLITAGASIQLNPLKSKTHTTGFPDGSERTNTSSGIRETAPGYSERKFICPNRQCGKEMILSPYEFDRKTYVCPHCYSTGSISSSVKNGQGKSSVGQSGSEPSSVSPDLILKISVISGGVLLCGVLISLFPFGAPIYGIAIGSFIKQWLFPGK